MSTPYYNYTTVNGVDVVTQEQWLFKGIHHHRIGGPSWREWEVVDGKLVLILEEWHLWGQRHRIDGPSWREWEIVGGRAVLTHESWHRRGVRVNPYIIRQPVRVIERWWLFQRARREKAIESLLWDSGMTVFPGFMGLLKGY
jgi:hypothetical protein